MLIPKRYIGDGVYVEVENGVLKLTTERENGEHRIFLEPEVFNALAEFYSDAVTVAKAMREREQRESV